MSADAGHETREHVSSGPITVRVDHNARGWRLRISSTVTVIPSALGPHQNFSGKT